jgi:hypothetical protein
MSADAVTALRMRARQIRDACSTTGNFFAGTTDSCAAASDVLEALAAKLEASPASASLQRAAARVLGQIGDGSDLASGSRLGDLADGIIASARSTGLGLGLAVAVGAGAFLVAKLLKVI